ncbi:MAG TPA: MarR family transcriptional regulator [Nitrolancea sp.]|nr:MarR family transcriptional regulator [Nitrolancea sp.]
MSSDIPDRNQLLNDLDREMRRISAQAVMFSQAVAIRLGINPTDLECLGIIGETGALTAGQLAELTGLTTGAITGVIDRLEKAGYVRRAQDPGDRRRVIVEPVPDVAEERITPLFESIGQATANLVSRYGDDQLAFVIDFATRMNQMTLAETAKLRAAEDDAGEGVFSSPLAGLTSGRLVFATGMSDVTIHGDATLTDLYQAHFEGQAPSIQVQDGTVTIKHRHRPQFEWSTRSLGEFKLNVTLPWQLGWLMRTVGDVSLNTSIPWQIEIRAGAANFKVDLSDMIVQSLSVKGGASQGTLTLPRPVGTVPVTIGTGASQVTIHRPKGVPTRVHVQKGAVRVNLDTQYFGAIGEMRWEGPEYEQATDRLDIEISGGASQLTIDTIDEPAGETAG